jgi:hypothetical protein
MLTHLDESPWHQCADTFDHVATSDPRFFDRFWFAASDPAGTATLQFTIGVYQNMNVVDGGFIIIHRDRQHNLRASRELRPSYQATCGPLALDVIDPLRVLGITIGPNDSGLSAALTWTAAAAPQQERPHFSRLRGRVAEDYARYDQIGTMSGSVDLDGTRLDVDQWWSCRDHSWGVRPGIGIPEPVTGTADPHEGFVFAFLFFSTGTWAGHAQITQRDHAAHLTAELRHQSGTVHPGTAIDLRATFTDASRPRRMRGATFAITTGAGETVTIEADPQGPAVAMAGLGYGGYDDGRGLGAYRGPEHTEHDVWDVSQPATVTFPDGTTARPLHRIQPVRVTVTDPSGASTGFGSCTMIAETGLEPDGTLHAITGE